MTLQYLQQCCYSHATPVNSQDFYITSASDSTANLIAITHISTPKLLKPLPHDVEAVRVITPQPKLITAFPLVHSVHSQPPGTDAHPSASNNPNFFLSLFCFVSLPNADTTSLPTQPPPPHAHLGMTHFSWGREEGRGQGREGEEKGRRVK